ncbi:MAG: hypothetical protein K6T90_02870 [Leptolyngbyaceae cyanobacterium HOT.MB2.61]|nr:hypothetical protein [Leptolyngbyaceae cyanobacterium HOT.MB2.61]
MLWLFRLPAGTARLGVLLNPVVGVMAAWWQLGETPGLTKAAGMVLIAVALMTKVIHALSSTHTS